MGWLEFRVPSSADHRVGQEAIKGVGTLGTYYLLMAV